MEQKGLGKTVVIGSIICSLVLLGVIGSYAYFMGNLGTNKQEEVNVQTGNLALTFADGNNGIMEVLEFGKSVEKTFTIENTGSLDATARIIWDNLVNTYIDGSLTYTLSSSDTETGTYINIVENQNVPVTSTSFKELLAGNLTIPTGSTKYYKLTITLNYLDDVDQTADLKASLSTHFSVEESDGKDKLINAEKIIKKLGKTVKDTKPNFATTATTDETKDGLFSMEDDYGTSYYYRGAVEDNYVKFGMWKEGDNVGKPMYWRIIRVNGDGSVRMIYDGISAHTNGESSADRVALTNVAWNISNHNDAKYVGYMYGGTNGTASTKRINLGEEGYADSGNAIYNETNTNIKNQIEAWYNHNLSELDEYVEDVVYCNDRSISETSKEWWVSESQERGYGKNVTAFGGWSRFFDADASYNTINPLPTLKCKDRNDSFTKQKSENGNGNLNEKVGLITVDEASLAGGTIALENTNYYLYKDLEYWSFSPRHLNTISNVFVFCLYAGGQITNIMPDKAIGVAPVISLTPEYFNTFIGDGTMSNPFREKGMEP